MHVAGVVVKTRPEDLPAVRQSIESMAGADIHASSEEGKLVVTLIGEDRKEVANALMGLGDIDRILNSTLVYEESDSDFFAEGVIQ